MDIKSLEQLMQPDERSRLFAYPVMEDGSFRIETDPGPEFIQGMVADCKLPVEVSDYVREQFEMCRKLHARGYFEYEFFTRAAAQSYIALESALGDRFMRYYNDAIPLVQERSGTEDALRTSDYGVVSAQLRRGGKAYSAGWRLMGYRNFDGSMASLVRWARAEGLLFGQRNRVIENAKRKLRNATAHPHTSYLTIPGHSARAIRDLAEITTRLWGYFTPGGRLYAPPMEMGLFAVRRRPTEGAIFTAPNMLTLQGSERDGLWSVVEASWPDQPELFGWSPDFETMGYPTKAIYHGHSWEEAVESLRQYVVAGRKLEPREWRDRIFLLRQIPARSGMFGYFEHCRSPEQFLGLSGDHRDLGGNRWLIFQADHPGSVAYYLDMRGRAGTLDEVGEVEGYPVKILGKFRTWEKAAARLADLAPDAYRL